MTEAVPSWVPGGSHRGTNRSPDVRSVVGELDLGKAANSLRTELREWLGEVVPTERDQRRAMVASGTWARLLGEQRLICPQWPREFGGRGLSGLELAALNDEFRIARVPKVTRGMGELLVGPSIIVHGTEEQKARFLPRIIDGSDQYCQGFSEPDAGSDLASLTTRALVDGEELVITGQKVWTSFHAEANMIFVLCRTAPRADKHDGITYVLVPIRQADGSANGIEFRPIRQITGDSHFAETWFDEARAPLDHVIGGLNEGWRVSMTTLGNERGQGAGTRHVEHEKMFWALVDEARRRGRCGDPRVRQEFAAFYSNVAIMRFQGLQLLSALATDRESGPGSSVGKMFWTEHQQRLTEYAMTILGADGMLDRGDDDQPGWWQALLLGSRAHTIWGGTAEVQRNIVAERVLGLPKDPVHTREKEDT